MHSNIETFRTSRHDRICLEELHGVNFCFEKKYPHCKLFTLNTLLDLRSLAFVKERIMALKQMIDKKTHFCLSYSILPFFPRANFVRGAFEDYPVWDKICK